MDVLTLHALRRGKNHTHRIVPAGAIIALVGTELDRVLGNLSGREATRQEVAAAKAGGSYFDGTAVTESVKAASANTGTAAPKAAAAVAAPAADDKPKPFDKMTKAELDAALAASTFDAPDNWATLKNFDRATFLQTETDKAAQAAADAAAAGGNGEGGEGSDLSI